MRFLGWLFDLHRRHYGDIKRYSKGTIGSKIFALIIMLILFGGTIALELWGFDLIKENFFTGLIELIFLALTTFVVTLDMCTLYCYLGLTMFFSGSIHNIVIKANERKKRKEGIEEVEKEPRAHNFLDLLVAIIGFILGIGLAVLSIYFASLSLSSK